MQNFLTNCQSRFVVFAFCKLISRSGFIAEVLDTKIQRGKNFLTNRHSRFVVFAFLQILSRSGFIAEVLDTKFNKLNN